MTLKWRRCARWVGGDGGDPQRNTITLIGGPEDTGQAEPLARRIANRPFKSPIRIIHTFSAAVSLQLERLLGKRSPAYAGRLLDPTPELPPEPTTPTS